MNTTKPPGRACAALAAGAFLFFASLHAARGSEAPDTVPPTLASGEEPIRLEGVEVRAIRGGGTTSDRLDLRLGTMSASIEGFTGEMRDAGFELGYTEAAIPPPEANLLAGAGIAVSTRSRESMFIGGGRVTLRDPIDVAALGAGGIEYWAAWGGLQIQF